MKMSFMPARKKSLFSSYTKSWILFLFLTVVMMVILQFAIGIMAQKMNEETIAIENSRVKLEKKISLINKKIEFTTKEVEFIEKLYDKNNYLKSSLKNLLDLIPTQITLTKIFMEKDSLVLYGVTPTQDVFKFLLEAPLKSIFHTSDTVFHLGKNGWYNFVSTNKIEGTGAVK